MQHFLNVKNFGAKGDNSADDTTAIAAALTLANSLAGGALGGVTVFFPRGRYVVSSPLVIPRKCILQGEGRRTSYIRVNHTGNGLTSTSTINTSTNVDVCIRDMGFYCLLSSVGGGFVETAGTNVSVHNCYFEGFKYGIIFDQTETSTITECDFAVQGNTAGIWLVNGPDHTVGANYGFTNLITIASCHFNSNTVGTQILDDGGANHVIVHNNINAGNLGIRIANASNVTVEDNFFESNNTHAIQLANDTLVGGVSQFANYGVVIRKNSFSTSSNAYHINIANMIGGQITDNVFVGNNKTAMINFGGNGIAGVLIEGNTKSPPTSTDVPFLDVTTTRLAMNNYRQRLVTSVSSSTASGSVSISPRDMGIAGTLERVKVGERVLVMDKDLTVPEIAVVTARNNTQLTLTLASAHAANFLVFGTGDTSIVEPLYTGEGYGSSSIANFTVHVAADPGASGWPFAWRVVGGTFRR